MVLPPCSGSRHDDAAVVHFLGVNGKQDSDPSRMVVRVVLVGHIVVRLTGRSEWLVWVLSLLLVVVVVLVRHAPVRNHHHHPVVRWKSHHSHKDSGGSVVLVLVSFFGGEPHDNLARFDPSRIPIWHGQSEIAHRPSPTIVPRFDWDGKFLALVRQTDHAAAVHPAV